MSSIEQSSRSFLYQALLESRATPGEALGSDLVGPAPGEPTAEAERRALVARLRAEVLAGSYSPDPRRVAEAVLSSAPSFAFSTGGH